MSVYLKERRVLMINREDAVIIGFILLIFIELFMLIRRLPAKRNALFMLFFAYIVLFIATVFFPIPYQTEGYDCDYNFIPLHTIADYLSDGSFYSILSLFGNIVLTVPLGCLLIPVFGISKQKGFWITALAFSVGTEAVQHLLNLAVGYRYRCVDIDDFILNMLGAAIGLLLYSLLFKKIFAYFLSDKN